MSVRGHSSVLGISIPLGSWGFFWGGGLFNIHVTVNRDNFISSLKIYMLLKIILAELPSEKCGIRVAREVPS